MKHYELFKHLSPEWRYLARNSCGTWMAYKNEPTQHEFYFDEAPTLNLGHGNDLLLIEYEGKWQESLISRETAERAELLDFLKERPSLRGLVK